MVKASGKVLGSLGGSVLVTTHMLYRQVCKLDALTLRMLTLTTASTTTCLPCFRPPKKTSAKCGCSTCLT